jgi:hypothetical protein
MVHDGNNNNNNNSKDNVAKRQTVPSGLINCRMVLNIAVAQLPTEIYCAALVKSQNV